MGHILSLFTYLLTTSVSSRVPGYWPYYPTGNQAINYPDTAALIGTHGNINTSAHAEAVSYYFTS